MVNQSLDGASLDLSLLDARVQEWKTECGLLFQDNFPPRTCEIKEGGLKFHDRSHILVQDFLQMSSWDLQEVFNETSIPPVFEEILTYFAAKVCYLLEREPSFFVTKSFASSDIDAMWGLEYIDENSVFIQQREESCKKITDFLTDMINKPHFEEFRFTLRQSTLDCEGWDFIVIEMPG